MVYFVSTAASFSSFPMATVYTAKSWALSTIIGTLVICAPTMLIFSRYLLLFKKHAYNRVFTHRQVWIYSGTLLMFHFLLLLPFILTGSMGREFSGICGVVVKNQLIQFYFIIFILYVIVHISLNLWCTWAILRRNHQFQQQCEELCEDSEELEQHVRMVKLVMISQLLPIVCTVLISLGKIVQNFVINQAVFDANPWLIIMLALPFNLTTISNPLVIFLSVREYRASRILRVLNILG